MSAIIRFEGIDIIANVKRVRTLRLSIKRDGSPQLTIPLGMNENIVLDFLQKNAQWLHTHVTKAKERYTQQKNLTQHAYTQGEFFQFLGKAYTLQIEHHNAPVHVTLTPDNKLLVQLRKDSSSTTLQRAINTWYHKQIQRIITQLLDQWLPIMQEGPLCEIRYKNMVSRWGSIKPQQRIVCFNLRLVFYPIEAIEQVVVHELCHLKEPSHNANFHALMAHYLPDYKQRKLLLQ